MMTTVWLPRLRMFTVVTNRNRRKLSNVDRRVVFNLLNVRKFENDELDKSFLLLTNDHTQDKISKQQLKDRIAELLQKERNNKAVGSGDPDKEVSGIVQALWHEGNGELGELTRDAFRSNVKTLGSKLDKRAWNLGGSFLAAGTSIGIIIPCMPMMIRELSISSSDFGLIVSAFGISKLLGNVPSAFYVDNVGRKPVMLAGLGMCSLGFCSFSLAMNPALLPVPCLIGSRLLTGLGVSAFTAGAFMMISDISTPLNRARTFAPVMAAFQAGIAMGPAIGGFAIENFGIPTTYLTCGFLFSAIAAVNNVTLPETKMQEANKLTSATAPPAVPPTSVKDAFSAALTSWRALSKNAQITDICSLNFVYFIALTGVQMTILPLHMVGPVFGLGASEIGLSFALMSVCSIGASQPAAVIADRYSKMGTTAGGCALLAGAMACMAEATTFPGLLSTLVPLAVGSTVLQSIPTAYIGDLTTPEDRAQVSLRLCVCVRAVLVLFLFGIVCEREK